MITGKKEEKESVEKIVLKVFEMLALWSIFDVFGLAKALTFFKCCKTASRRSLMYREWLHLREV